MTNYYRIGAESSTSDNGKSWTGILIALGLVAGIYGLSPGARHYYKTGKLPR